MLSQARRANNVLHSWDQSKYIGPAGADTNPDQSIRRSDSISLASPMLLESWKWDIITSWLDTSWTPWRPWIKYWIIDRWSRSLIRDSHHLYSKLSTNWSLLHEDVLWTLGVDHFGRYIPCFHTRFSYSYPFFLIIISDHFSWVSIVASKSPRHVCIEAIWDWTACWVDLWR